MKFFWPLIFTLIISACVVEKGDIRVDVKKNNKNSQISSANVSSISIVNNQVIVSGNNLSVVTGLKINGVSFNELFTIESKSSNQIIANANRAFSFDVSKIFELILSDAQGSAAFPISFDLANKSVTAPKLHSMGAAIGQVLKYDGVDWVASTLSNSQIYLGTYDATLNTPDLNATSPISGDYYIITTAGTFNAINYEVGDWIMHNGSSWEKISNSTNVVSSFNGRRGIVVSAIGDYSWSMLTNAGGKLTGSKLENIADIDLTGIANNKILKWDAANLKWIMGDDLSGGGAGSVTTGEISDGTITNVDIDAAAAIAYSKLNIPVGAIDYTKLTIADNQIPMIKVNGLTSAISGLLASSIVDADTTHAPTGDAVFDALGLKLNLSGGLINPGGTITGLPALPLVGSEATSKDYVDAQITTVTTLANGKISKAGDTISSGTLLINGTAHISLPAPTLLTDPTTKDYVDTQIAGASNQWAYTGGDVYRASGNVGIGTTAPTARLTVSGNSSVLPAPLAGTTVHIGGADSMPVRLLLDSFGTGSAATANMTLRTAGGTAASPTTTASGDVLGQLSWSGYGATTYASGARASIRATAANTWTDTAQGAYMAFYTTSASGTGNVEKMRITDSGNVGVGTTTPAALLDVNGDAILRNSAGGVFQTNTGNRDYDFTGNSPTNRVLTVHPGVNAGTSYSNIVVDFYGNDGITNIPGFTLLRNGNVGIGMTAPSAALDVQNNSTASGSVTAKLLQPNHPINTSSYLKIGRDVATTYNAADIAFAYTGSNSNQNRLDLGFQGIAPILSVRADGNVGIGTTSPSANVDIVATDNPTSIRVQNINSTAARTPNIQMFNYDGTGFGGYSLFDFYEARGSSAAPSAVQSGDTLGKLRAHGYGASAWGNSAYITFQAAENYTNTAHGADVIFLTSSVGSANPTEKMRITANGNVGIGTSTPGLVLGSVNWSGKNLNLNNTTDRSTLTLEGTYADLNLVSTANTLDQKILTIRNQGDKTFFRVHTDTGTTNKDLLTLNHMSGNVGIGTSTPAYQLDLNGGATSINARIYGSNPDSAVMRFENTSASGGRIYHVGSTDSISSAGNGFSIYDATAAASRLLVNPSGNVGIGITNPTYLLQLGTDSAAKPGTSTWTIASDERLKDIRAPFVRGLDAIEEINPIYFRYKKGNPLELPSNKEFVGIRAQDALKVVPEAVSKDDSGYFHVTNDAIIWTMLNAIKELYHRWTDDKILVHREIASVKSAKADKSEVAQLQAENIKLKQENALIKARLDRIEKALSRQRKIQN